METLIARLAPVFEKYSDHLVAAYIFGSIVDKKETSRSDVDIAVLPVNHDKQVLFELKDQLYPDLCRALKRDDVDLVLLKLVKNLMLIDRIIHHGLLVWEKDTEGRKDFEACKLHEIIDFKEHRLRTLGI